MTGAHILTRIALTLTSAGMASLGVWPLAPTPPVWQEFEAPAVRWAPGHRGADLLGHPGQPVVSALAGRTAFAGTVAGVPVVSIDHPDGTRTTYQPVVAAVRAGDTIPAGGLLGALVPVGSHCAPATCLHWGLRRGTEYLDPLSLVRAPQVRLLPLAGLA